MDDGCFYMSASFIPKFSISTQTEVQSNSWLLHDCFPRHNTGITNTLNVIHSFPNTTSTRKSPYICVCPMYSKKGWSWLINLFSVLSIKAIECCFLLLSSLFFLSCLWYHSWVLIIHPINTSQFCLFLLPYNLKSNPFFYLSKPWKPTCSFC